ELARRGVATFQMWYGPDDVRCATPLGALGVVLGSRGYVSRSRADLDEGRAALEHALAISQRAKRVMEAAVDESELGTLEIEADRLDLAVPHFERALQLKREAGATPYMLAKTEINIAVIEQQRGQAAPALARATRILAV